MFPSEDEHLFKKTFTTSCDPTGLIVMRINDKVPSKLGEVDLGQVDIG